MVREILKQRRGIRMDIILFLILWIGLGMWGSLIGHRYFDRHYGVGSFWGGWGTVFYLFMALFGPMDLLVTTVMFFKR